MKKEYSFEVILFSTGKVSRFIQKEIIEEDQMLQKAEEITKPYIEKGIKVLTVNWFHQKPNGSLQRGTLE